MIMPRGSRLVLPVVTAGLVAVALLGAAGGARAGALAGARAVPVKAPAVPRYYLALPGGDNFANVPGARTAVLGDTVTGKRVLTVRPSGADKFVTVAAAANDRTFVLGAEPNPQPPALPEATDWYLVHVAIGHRPAATIRKLPMTPPVGYGAGSTALSPDGRRLAILYSGSGKPDTVLRIYSVATGAVQGTWAGTIGGNLFSGYNDLSWLADGHRVAFEYGHFVSGQDYDVARILDLSRPGRNLITGSRVVFVLKRPGTLSSQHPFGCEYGGGISVTGDGKTVICGATGVGKDPDTSNATCPAVRPFATVAFLEYSTATRKLVRTLYRAATNCIPSLFNPSDILWASPAGDRIIGYFGFGMPPLTTTYFLRFGLFTHGKFTPLPKPPTTAPVPRTIAW